jgi:hypothetical protein
MLRAFGVIGLVLLGVAGVGFVRGWFTVSGADGTSRPAPHVAIDQDKVGDDLEKVQGLLVDKIVTGTIRALDAAHQELRVAHEEGELDLKVTNETSIRCFDRKLSFADLAVEDTVWVAYETNREVHTARRIKVKR